MLEFHPDVSVHRLISPISPWSRFLPARPTSYGLVIGVLSDVIPRFQTLLIGEPLVLHRSSIRQLPNVEIPLFNSAAVIYIVV